MMSRATAVLTALAAALATTAAARPAPAATAAASTALAAPALAAPAAKNCARRIRIGVFEEANPFVVAYMAGWMDDEATACYSFHHMPTGNRAIELIAIGFLDLAVVGTTPLTSAVTRGLELRSYQRVHKLGGGEGLVVRSSITRPTQLRGKEIWVPQTTTAHYIVLAALNEFSLDIEQLTIEFAEPQAIRDASDAGIIDGAGCWGNTLHHLTTKPHGGDNETEPGHIIVDATTVARWGYVTYNNLVTTRENLYKLETDQIENGTAPNLILETLKYFARANYDYRFRPRPLPGEPEGPWGWNSTYNKLVQGYLSRGGIEEVSLFDVENRMSKFGYPTIQEQLAVGLDSRADAYLKQADFVYRQKALALPPTREQFLNTAWSPETSVTVGAGTGQAAADAAVAFERIPLDVGPEPLPNTPVALVQRPVAGEACESYALVDVSNTTSATFEDGSTGINAYQNNARCVWAIRSTTNCVSLILPFLSTEPNSDMVEVYSDGGTLLARFSGRSTEVPEIVRCMNPENGRETRETVIRSLAGPDAPVHDNVSMYVRWTSDDFDEVAVGSVLEPVGFTATASVAAAAAPACKPGWGGALCDYPACFGIDVENQRGGSGTLRSQPAGVDEYKPYSFCAWAIPTGDEATHIKFDFKALGLEFIFDRVSIYREADGAGDYGLASQERREQLEANYAYRISGNSTPKESIIIEGDTLVFFESDGMINGAGFELEYSVFNYRCPGETGVDGACICPLGRYGLNCALKSCIGDAPRVSQSNGRIKSGLEDDYLPANTCLWQVDLAGSATAGQLQAAELRFSTFDLERLTIDSAVSDVVEVYEVPNGEKALRSKLTEYKLLQSFAQDEFERGIYDIGRPERLEFTGTANGTSIAIVFSTDMSNPQPHSGFELTYSGVYGGEPFCSDEDWPCDNEFECIDGVCTLPTSAPRGSKKNNIKFPDWAKGLLIVLACLVFVLLGALLVWRVTRFVKKSVALRREHTLLVHEQVTTAMDRIEELQAHLTVVPGETFLALGSLKSHESMEAETITYHTVNEVRDAQASGLVFAFLSHQWLGWSAPDPANKHYESMCCAIQAVAEASGVDVSAIRVWVDFVSIPQANRAEQRLAITSLPAFSACCDVFIVVAPEATHADTLKTCDCATYKKRAWCRAEIFSFWARHGADDMYLLSSDGHLNQLEITDDCLEVFSGEMTCCPVWKSTSELVYPEKYCVDLREPPRHRADVATGTMSRRWRGAPEI